MYSATAEIQIRPRDFTAIEQLGPDGLHAMYPWPATEVQEIRSDENLRVVIRKLNLDETWAERFKYGNEKPSPLEALDRFHKILNIEAVPQTNIFKITAFSEVPQEAADIANTVADAYKAKRDQDQAERLKRGLDSLRERIAKEQNELDNARYFTAKASNDGQREVGQSVARKAQNDLDDLNVRLRRVIADSNFPESCVRVVTRAVAPPE